MSSVDSALRPAAPFTYDFFAKIKKGPPKKILKRRSHNHGRPLVARMLIAPFIRNFKGLFDYLFAVWAFLSPGVFVTVMFGLFYENPLNELLTGH